MGLIQSLIMRLSGEKLAQRMRQQSQAYVATCKNCDQEFSIWDIGGIRYGASNSRKAAYVACPHCGTRQWAKFARKPEP